MCVISVLIYSVCLSVIHALYGRPAIRVVIDKKARLSHGIVRHAVSVENLPTAGGTTVRNNRIYKANNRYMTLQVTQWPESIGHISLPINNLHSQ